MFMADLRNSLSIVYTSSLIQITLFTELDVCFSQSTSPVELDSVTELTITVWQH